MTRTMGIDLGTHKASYVVLDHDQSIVSAHTEDCGNVIRHISLRAVAQFITGTAKFYQVDHIWVEEAIIGNNRKYSIQLAQMQGAVLYALTDCYHLYGARIESIDNKVWKKLIVGNGNATKNQIRDYIHVTHPSYALLCGDQQDCYDAACIALAGIKLGQTASEPGLLVGSDPAADA